MFWATRQAETPDCYRWRDALVGHYHDLVVTVRRSNLRGYPCHVEEADLLQEGMVALIRAVQHFDPHLGVKFETYAARVILGAMRQYLRKDDWLPRAVRARERLMQQLDDQIVLTGAAAGIGAVDDAARAEALGLADLDAFYDACGDVPRALVSITEECASVIDRLDTFCDDGCPFDPVLREIQVTLLSDCLCCLLPRLRQVIRLYYYDGMTMKQAARVMSISPTRFGQLHASAMARIREHLKASRNCALFVAEEADVSARLPGFA